VHKLTQHITDWSLCIS